MESCKLCEKNSVLKNSHLLPKAAYKIIGKSKKRRESPIMIRSLRNVASPSDYQYCKELLCSECEQLFSNREHAVSKFWFRKPGFLLRNQLRQVALYDYEEGRRFYHRYPPVGLKQSDLYYFSLSLVWRACQGRWGDFEGLSVFPPKLEQQVRQFLLGEGPSPSSIKVLVYVDWGGKLEQVITLPTADSGRVQIVVLGLCIEVHVSIFGNDPVVLALESLGQDVSLILDKVRCNEVFEYAAQVTQRINKSNSGKAFFE